MISLLVNLHIQCEIRTVMIWTWDNCNSDSFEQQTVYCCMQANGCSVVTIQLVISWKVTKNSCNIYTSTMKPHFVINKGFRFLGYLLPSSHTLPLTTVKQARLTRSSICSILLALDIGDGCGQKLQNWVTYLNT